MKRSWMAGVLCALLSAPVGAQEPPPDLRGRVFRVETEVVVLDVVVRDRKGRTVRDLRPEEVEVYEDGVKQAVASFRLLDAAAPASAAEAPVRQAEAPDEGRYVNLVSLVFDQLGPDGRRLARQAALDLLKLEDRPDLYMSVFQVGESLRLLQQFTKDREPLREAVKRATGELNTQYTPATDDLAAATRAADLARQQLQSGAQSGGAGGAGAVAQLSQEAAMAEMLVNALRMTETLQREQQGHSSLFALLALAKQQQRLAGRKTILFFSEGLQTPPTLEHVLQAAISEANRANVSIYAVDARGLVTSNSLDAARDTLRQAAMTSQQQMLKRGVGAVTREEVMIADTAEVSLRMDVQGALGDLATSTGGLLIGNTNDVRTGIERAVHDLSGYYELVYSPSNREYDGRFRRIALKVSRPGVVVQTRSGYFALPPGEGSATFAFELDLLRTLRATPPPQDFAFRARAFRFGYEEGRLRHTLVLELPLESVSFERDSQAGQDRAHVSFMGVLRDGAGGIAAKFSQDSPVKVPHDKVPALRQGNALFIRSFTLSPGRYTLETAAIDQQSHKKSVRRSVLVVPPDQPRLAVSSLAVVKRTEPVAAGALGSDDPFRLGSTRIVPSVGEPEVASGQPLSLFLVAYPARATQHAALVLEFVRDGVVVGRSEVELPGPDATGRIPYVATLPDTHFAPGRYEVRAEVRQGPETAQETVFFKVAEPSR
jgi:VWFA-related protein